MRVLLADDHALFREGLAQLLRQHRDIEVTDAVATGRDAVDLCESRRPDLAVLDVSMPDLNGIEAARQILQRAPGVRVVVLSMHSGVQHVCQALAAGARGYILKNAASAEVAQALRSVMAGRRYLSPDVAAAVNAQLGSSGVITPLERLSARERQVLQLVAEGNSSSEIGALLALSPKSVDTYRSRLMSKLDLDDVTDVVRFAISHGLTPPE
jgi:DNA-binding NarL/FixJ family response regulator